MQTSTYSAEYGRTAGAQINVVSKSGTNNVDGSVFEYLRNDMFDANNFFTQPGDDKSLRRHQAGGTIGGPVRRDRTFYFGSYEHTYERRSETRNTTAPRTGRLKLLKPLPVASFGSEEIQPWRGATQPPSATARAGTAAPY